MRRCFRILASPKSNIAGPADLKGVPIGISNNTIIEYLTDRILTSEGLTAEDIAKIEVGAITVRFEQLMNGNVQAAVLPDPLAQGAIAAGAKLVVDDTKYTEPVSVGPGVPGEHAEVEAGDRAQVPQRLGAGGQGSQRQP